MKKQPNLYRDLLFQHAKEKVRSHLHCYLFCYYDSMCCVVSLFMFVTAQSEAVIQIDKDIPRTFASHGVFARET